MGICYIMCYLNVLVVVIFVYCFDYDWGVDMCGEDVDFVGVFDVCVVGYGDVCCS